MKLAYASLVLGLTLAGCARPDPPKLTPRSATVTSITPLGIDFDVKLDAENPNGIELSAHALTAKVTLDGKYDLGSVTTKKPVVLPAHKTTPVEAPVSMKWRDLTSVAGFVAQNRDIPYEVDGTVELGNDTFNVDVPFQMKGTLTRADLARAVASSLPKIPGLPTIAP